MLCSYQEIVYCTAANISKRKPFVLGVAAETTSNSLYQKHIYVDLATAKSVALVYKFIV